VEAYRKVSKDAGKVWMEHGALEYRAGSQASAQTDGAERYVSSALEEGSQWGYL
jgi:uncharacterized protein YbaA (DUF1428 family)